MEEKVCPTRIEKSKERTVKTFWMYWDVSFDNTANTAVSESKEVSVEERKGNVTAAVMPQRTEGTKILRFVRVDVREVCPVDGLVVVAQTEEQGRRLNSEG